MNAGPIASVLFAVGGTIAFVFLSVKPMSNYLAARQWEEVPCTVTKSSLSQKISLSGGTDKKQSSSYRIVVKYTYEFNGETYEGDRYDVTDGATTKKGGKAKIKEALKPGTKTVCYVDPQNPSQSMLRIGFRPIMLWALSPLIFMAVGYYGIYTMVRGFFRKPEEGPLADSTAD